MSVVSQNVVVRDERGGIVKLFAGDEVPGWAETLIGDHLLGGEPKPAKTAKPTKANAEPAKTDGDGEDDTNPAGLDFTKPAPKRRNRKADQ